MDKGKKPSGLEKIPKALLSVFNYRAYPYINLDTTELEWYVSTNDPMYKTIQSSNLSSSRYNTKI